MAKGLSYGSGRDMPPGMQALAASKFIELEAAMMLQVLKEVDIDCQFCKHAGFGAPCLDEEEEELVTSCDKCQHTCSCRGCYDNSKYEWCGATEARKRLTEMKGEK